MSIKIILQRLHPNDQAALQGSCKTLQVNFGLQFRLRGWSPAERHRGSTHSVCLRALNIIKRTALLRPGPRPPAASSFLKWPRTRRGRRHLCAPCPSIPCPRTIYMNMYMPCRMLRDQGSIYSSRQALLSLRDMQGCLLEE